MDDMKRGPADKTADIKAAHDRGEMPFQMEPLILSQQSKDRLGLYEAAFDLTAASTGFRRSIPDSIVPALANVVREMNCYYSNLIEGHQTHPVDIERALRNDYSSEPEKRDLQLEAKAHVLVQQWIDQGGIRGRALTQAAISEVHRRFCELLPPAMLTISDPESGQTATVQPGSYREQDVKVGNHLALSPGAIGRFVQRFENVYSSLGRVDTLLSSAASHHRLLWIHPFLDGNGRVARLMSHAVLLDALDTGGIWSVARALARNVAKYKQHLVACDSPRRNDLDGRGALSEESLAAFTQFFLQVCSDQVRFMQELVQPNGLRERIFRWARQQVEMGTLPTSSTQVLEALLYRGELARGDVPAIIGATDRHARRVVAALVDQGVMSSDNMRSPWRLAFPATLAGQWLPGLFPEQSPLG